MTPKVFCAECDWKGLNADCLSAPSPFDGTEFLIGCPQCKSVNSIIPACEYENCWKAVTCGTPHVGGYAQTCGQHYQMFA